MLLDFAGNEAEFTVNDTLCPPGDLKLLNTVFDMKSSVYNSEYCLCQHAIILYENGIFVQHIIRPYNIKKKFSGPNDALTKVTLTKVTDAFVTQ